MTKTTTITINGRLYDAISGMPVSERGSDQPAAAKSPKLPLRTFSDIGPRLPFKRRPAAKPASANLTEHLKRADAVEMHRHPQKSETLRRAAVKKPVIKYPEASLSTTDLPSRSPLISRFGPNVTVHTNLTPRQAPEADELPIKPAAQHPSVTRALQRQSDAKQSVEQLHGTALKEKLIKDRLADVDVADDKPKVRWFARKPRLATILTTSLALLVLGGYLTYMNLPIISMQVAASRAGVHATMPGYNPDGYSLSGPITYAPGEISLNYKSNTNDNGFKLTQKPSNWDSQAVLDNYVSKETETYLTFQERGIKVYTFGNKAAWVNAGLLYTVDGTATLSSDQILRLATSM